MVTYVMNSNETIKPLVTKIQKFCTHDGPGIRTTVFLKGCPLRCKWCHNPETQKFTNEYYYSKDLCIGCSACVNVCEEGCHSFENGMHIINRKLCQGCNKCSNICPSSALEVCGRKMDVNEIIHQVMQDKSFYGNNGGLTISGGEPMAQPKETLTLLEVAKESGLNTVLETCGYFDSKYVSKLSKLVDLFLYDFKDSDPIRHKENTGVSLDTILKNLHLLDKLGCKIRLRCIMISGVNMNENHFVEICKLYHSLNNCEGVELLPYHQFGDGKNALLGELSYSKTEWVPSNKEMLKARKYLRKNKVKVI